MLGPPDQENQSERRGSGDIRPIPLGFINVDCFLRRIFQPPITLRKTQSVVATLEIIDYSRTMMQHFLPRKLGISLQLCIQLAMNFQ